MKHGPAILAIGAAALAAFVLFRPRAAVAPSPGLFSRTVNAIGDAVQGVVDTVKEVVPPPPANVPYADPPTNYFPVPDARVGGRVTPTWRGLYDGGTPYDYGVGPKLDTNGLYF